MREQKQREKKIAAIPLQSKKIENSGKKNP